MQQWKHPQRKKHPNPQKKKISLITQKNPDKKIESRTPETTSHPHPHGPKIQFDFQIDEKNYWGKNMRWVQKFQSLWNGRYHEIIPHQQKKYRGQHSNQDSYFELRRRKDVYMANWGLQK